MRDSQRVRAASSPSASTLDAARWRSRRILFELEMLLLGVDRFFNLRATSSAGGRRPRRDFRDELKAGRDASPGPYTTRG
jgi:hypothetical protein